jgi:hypothetical protein
MTPNALAASGVLTTRTLLGNAPTVVGVAGNTLTLEWGLRVAAAALPRCDVEVLVGLAREAEDVLEALECVCWCPWDAAWGIDRMLETELLVDFRPRSPAPDRR